MRVTDAKVAIRGGQLHRSMPSQVEFHDNSLMRQIIESNRALFLKKPALGWTIDNIHTSKFIKSTYRLRRHDGSEKSFTGKTLLLSRDKRQTLSGVIALLMELGIEVTGESRRLPNPTEAEYQDNDLMRQVIEDGKDQFLKDPALGWTADNIQPHGFTNSTFKCRNSAGEERQFLGTTLLRQRGIETTRIAGIVKLLRELGIIITGEIKQTMHPSETEYQDDALMKRAIENGKDQFLKDPAQGWTVDNISADKYADSTFYLNNSAEGEKRFTGKTLLKKRGQETTMFGIVKVLREIGIEISGEPTQAVNPSDDEYQDNELIRRAIENSKDTFLTDPAQGWITSNISSGKFISGTFTFCNAAGMEKRFTGTTLLRKRGYALSKDGVITLLTELNMTIVATASSPSEAEYQNHFLMRQVLQDHQDQFLRDPELGWVAKNIAFRKFCRSTYCYRNQDGEERSFTGQSLLKNRGQRLALAGIIALLAELGVDVDGNVGEPATLLELQDNDLMRQAIANGQEQFLRNPEIGWVSDNIQVHEFTFANFRFVNAAGQKKRFTGQTLFKNRNIERTKGNLLAMLIEIGIPVFETTAEAVLEKYNLHDEVARLDDDPAVLYRYLLLTKPDLAEESIRQIVIHSFRGIRDNKQVAVAELHAGYQETEGKVTVSDLPDTTEEAYVELSGRVEGTFEYVQVANDCTKRIVVNRDGTWSGKVRLKIGEQNRLFLYGINDSTKTKCPSTELTITQTSSKSDPETALEELVNKVDGLAEELSADPHRLAYLTRTIERSLMTHFMGSAAEGFAYLERKIAECQSPLFQEVYKQIQKKFKQIGELVVPGFRPERELYFFQKYSLYEILESMREEDGANGTILACEQGLGKTVIALAALKMAEKPGLVVTPNAVLSTWGEQAGYFFADDQPIRLIRGDSPARARKMTEQSAGTRVTNIEYLRGEGHDRFARMNLPGEEQILVFDESQFLTSTTSQQAAGARKLQGRFRLLISATPFANISSARPILEFLEEGTYGTSQAFSSAFRQTDPRSVRLLHLMLDRHLIRLRKKDVFKEYDPALPLVGQPNCLPAKEYIPPAQLGEYELTETQCEAILDIFLHWEVWQARLKGRPLTYEDWLIYNKTKNFFSRRESLRQLMNNPRYGGVSLEESPKHNKVDDIVSHEVDAGKGKLLIFCRYRAEVEELAKRYNGFGIQTLTYYGGTSEIDGKKQEYLKNERGQVKTYRLSGENEYAIGPDGKLIEDPSGIPITPLDFSRLMFQHDPETKILIASYDSGAVGVTFTAADAVVFSDLPRDYVTRYQAEDRANRIDNERRKYCVRYYTMVAKYPNSFLERMKKYAVVRVKGTTAVALKLKSEITEEMRADGTIQIEDVYEAYLAQGTYDEVHSQYIEAQKRIFELIIDGIQSEQEQEDSVTSVLSSKMPFLFSNDQTTGENAREENVLSTQIEEESAGVEVDD